MLIKRSKVKDLNQIIDRLKHKKFDIKLQYKFIKIKKAIEEEEEIYREQIKLNCEQFFEKDSTNTPIVNADGAYKIKADKMNECYLVMQEMNNIDVQIPDIYFSLDELEILDLTLEELSILEVFIK